MSEIVESLRGTLTGHATDDEMWERVIREREEAAATITRLTAEVESIRRAIPDEFILDPPDGGDVSTVEGVRRMAEDLKKLRDPTLSHMRLENGCLDMALVSPVIEGLATALGGWFIAGGAKNYAEMRLHDRHETGAIYIVTVQKSGAKTPHQLRQEAEAELATIRAENERLRDELAKTREWAMSASRAALSQKENGNG